MFQWYLQQRMASLSALIVAWLQTLVLTWALVCSVTRITDHRHHWWDVLAGSILGVALGIYTVSIILPSSLSSCCNTTAINSSIILCFPTTHLSSYLLSMIHLGKCFWNRYILPHPHHHVVATINSSMTFRIITTQYVF